MTMIGVSAGASRANPALAAWLAGAGIAAVKMTAEDAPARGVRRILDAAEVAHATHRDLLVEIGEGEASFVAAQHGLPARIRCGLDDLGFGMALIAELVREPGAPACGEPDSALYLRLAARVAQADITVLINGPTGTGKEVLARAIHAGSPRRDGPFIAINCAALPETMLEAMLFGHQKGAFTGASSGGEGFFRAAHGGTLLLDEIAELPLALQAKLLRAIQEREVLPVGATRTVPVDVRIVAAANRELANEVAEGRFRADLYWRLNVMPLTLKPLKARRLDIRAITAALLLRHARDDFAWPTAAALDRLMAHDWPGNVRELENVLQRALLLRSGDRIDADDLAIEGAAPAPSPATQSSKVVALPQRLHEVSRGAQAEAIRAALEATGGHRVLAAARLGISERTLRYRLAEMRSAA
jgi:two-component system, response regulator FlrC